MIKTEKGKEVMGKDGKGDSKGWGRMEKGDDEGKQWMAKYGKVKKKGRGRMEKGNEDGKQWRGEKNGKG